MTNQKKKSPRLGRGLSSLMSKPVQIHPPTTDPHPEVAPELSPELTPEASQEESPETTKEVASEATPVVAASVVSSKEASVAVAEPEKGGVADKPVHSEVNTASKPESPAKSAFIPVRDRGYQPNNQVGRPAESKPVGDGLVYLSVTVLEPNRHQPRTHFDQAGLKRLADSIASEGVMQPIIARPSASGSGRYEVVAGERRWRAAQIAGLDKVPVIVRKLNDRQIAEWALIENLQREDLNPIERAEAFSRLIDQFGLSHEEAGKRVGMDRSSITNHLRLLTLAGPVKQLIIENLLSMGQARAIAGLSDVGQQVMLAERAVRKGLSVREVEAAVRKLTSPSDPTASSGSKTPSGKAAYLVDLEKQMTEQLGTKVAIKPGRKKGTGSLIIDFYDLDQFDSLAQKLGVNMD